MSETNQSALIFIPDISGFTKFVNETDSTHSSHIISELLEIIINANELDLSLSEVEGDAVLFYRFGKAPGLVDVNKQVEKMFLNFHAHLKRYDRDRICNCGACSMASQLTLKFIVHQGKISTMQVQNHHKLIGSDVIVTHRLLKNNIPGNEYVLLSNKYYDSVLNGSAPSGLSRAQSREVEGITMEEGSAGYDELGEVGYKYYSLSPLLQMVPEPHQPASPPMIKNPVTVETIVNATVKDIYYVCADFNLKAKLTQGKVVIERDEQGMPVIGTRHRCIQANGKVFNFEASVSVIEQDHAEYGESLLSKNPIVYGVTNRYIMDKDTDGQTKLRLEMHYQTMPVLGQLLDFMIRSRLKKMAKKGLAELKEYCEAKLEPAFKKETASP